MTPSVVMRDVSVSLRGKKGSSVAALRNISFEIPPGQRVSLMGPNGAGKTTLLLALVGAVEFSGSIEIEGTPVTRDTLNRARGQVGFVFSNPDDQLFCETVDEEVRLGPKQAGLPAEEQATRVAAALEHVGLTGFESRHPSELSLGEKRRLAAACALAQRAPLFLFDEPTSSLDPASRRRMLDVLGQHSGTVVIATHDLDAAERLESRVLLLSSGRLLADGSARELLHDKSLLDRAGLGA